MLEGLQILDLADEKASFCSKLLADLGAEVIKIERPGGDDSRQIGPFWENTPHPERSLSFWYNNSNKLGITLNLEDEEGRGIFCQLASKTDVVIETFPPGYLEKLKLDYASLVKINPRLILASVTGFGQTGPYRQYKSCDIVASATGGQMYICGAPNTPPLKPYGDQSYFVASLFAAIGVLIALHERNQSGKGQHIDISLQEAVASTLGHVFIRYFYDGIISHRQGHYDRDGSFCLLPCQEGYIFLAIEREWDILVSLLDNEGMVEDLKNEIWQDSQYRRRHIDYIVEILSRWTKKHARDELFLLGQSMRLPWAPVNSLPEMVNNLQLSERNFIVPVEHSELCSKTRVDPLCYRYPSTPYVVARISQSPEHSEGVATRQSQKTFRRDCFASLAMTGKSAIKRAPLIAEHNAQVCQERLRLSSEDLKRLSLNGHCEAQSAEAIRATHQDCYTSPSFHSAIQFTTMTTGRTSPRVKNSKTMDKDALQGIRILDLTWLLAGPYATRILADFGAEVIKVQSKKTATGAEDNTAGYFNTWNRGKLSIALDMSYPQAKNIILKLVKISDVVIENFTPRVMSNWGLSYDELTKANPNIIMVSMSGMGQTGPFRDFAALGHTIQAFSGITCLTSFPSKPSLTASCNDGQENDKSSPLGLGYPYADPVAGLFAVFAILAALEYRNKTGQGQYIDVSEYEALCSSLGTAILDCTVNNNIASPQGNGPSYDQSTPYGCYRCLGDNRWCVIAVSKEKEWQALCQVLEYPVWSNEDRFSNFFSQRSHTSELDKLIEQWTIRHTPEEVMKLLQRAGIPVGIVEDAADLTNDPQLMARNFFVQIEHPILGRTTSDNIPIKLSRTSASIHRTAPLLGQDNEYVYRGLLGMCQEELYQYMERGILS